LTQIVDTQEYLHRLLTIDRPGVEKILAFYDHRLGVICKDPRLLYIPMDDHLVHRGDGVFETLKFVCSGIYQLDAHLERMKKSCSTIFLQPPCSWDEIRKLVLEVCASTACEKGLVSLFIGRGPGGFSVDFRECPQSSLYIVTREHPVYSEEMWEQGVKAYKTQIPPKQGYLSQIKSVDYLPNVLMKREAVLNGNDYPFCFDKQGYLVEGATENVCIVTSEGKLVVPELRRALPGTTLIRALELVKAEVDIEYRRVHEEEIHEAMEVILLGTSIDALSVVSFNNAPVNETRVGPVSRRLRELIVRDQKENGVPMYSTGAA